ncbi:MAG: ion transporter [Pseudomonadota bacterium]
MKRREFVEYLDGIHPRLGRELALAHQALIVLAAVAIAVSTVKDLPPEVVRALAIFDIAILIIFTIEYFVRIVCAPRPMRYIFSFWGIIDFLACLPIIFVVSQQWAAIRTLRLLRLVWVLKLLHSNRALQRLQLALHKSRGELLVFAMLASIILYIASVGIYIFEHEAQPDKFSSVPICLWWAVVSFTTVGYGDMFPITPGGQIFTSLILFIGLGVIAVPTAIITTALIQTDLTKEIEDEVREDVQKDLRKGTAPLRRQPRRRS